MKTREVKLHEVKITFLVPEYEIDGAISNGATPAAQNLIERGELTKLEALAGMFADALSGNEVGSLEAERMSVEIDGELIVDGEKES